MTRFPTDSTPGAPPRGRGPVGEPLEAEDTNGASAAPKEEASDGEETTTAKPTRAGTTPGNEGSTFVRGKTRRVTGATTPPGTSAGVTPTADGEPGRKPTARTVLDKVRTAAAKLGGGNDKPQTLGDLIWKDLRGAIVGRLLEARSRAQAAPRVEEIHTEIRYWESAIASLDALRESGSPVPPRLLADATKLREALGEDLGAAVRDGRRRRLNGGASGGIAGDFAERARRLAADASRRAPTTPEIPGVPSVFRDGSTLLGDFLSSAPHDLHAEVGRVVDDALRGTASAGELADRLPPFAFRLPRDVTHDDGRGNRIFLPAGSRIEARDGQLLARGAGVIISSGSTTFVAREANLALGGDLDRLMFGELSVGSGGSAVLLSGVGAELDHRTGGALVVADRLSLDLDAGKLDLEGATLRYDPAGQVDLEAARLALVSPDRNASLDNLHLRHTTDGETSRLVGGADNLRGDWQGTALTADRLRVDLTRRGTDDTVHMEGDNIRLAQDGLDLALPHATLDASRAVDGSGGISLVSRDGVMTSTSGTLTTVGETTLGLTYAPGGVLTGIGARGADVSWRDSQDSLLHVRDGVLDLRVDPRGEISGATGNARRVDFTDGAGSVSVDDGRLTMDRLADGGMNLAAAAHHVDIQRDGSTVRGDDVTLTSQWSAEGLRQLDVSAGKVDAQGEFGNVRLDGTSTLGLRYDAQGNLSQAALTAARGHYVKDGRSVDLTGGSLDVSLTPTGDLEQLKARATTLRYVDADGSVDVRGGSLDVLRRPDGTSQLDAQAASLDVLRDGNHLVGSDVTLSSQWNDAGLKQLDVSIGKLDATGEFGALKLDGKTTLGLTYDGDGNLSRAALTATHARFTHADTNLGVKNGSLDIGLRDGAIAEVTARAATVDYDKGTTHLGLTDGRLDARFDGEGALLSLQGSAKNVAVSGTGSSGAALAGSLAEVRIEMQQQGEGERIALFAADGQATIDGKRVTLTGIAELEVLTNADGGLAQANLAIPGEVSFVEEQEQLTARIQGVSAHADPTRLQLTFNEADVELRGEGVKAFLRGGEVDIQERQARFAVSDLRILKELEGQLDFSAHVTGLEVVLRSGENGLLQSADLSLASLTAATEQMNLWVETPEGKKLRLSTRLDESGTQLREVFLQIPEGGEVRLATDDAQVRFGPLTAKLEQDASGALRLGLHDFEVDATFKDVTVRAQGGTVDVGLDPERGLIIRDITSTKINVHAGEHDIDIDIRELDGMMLRMTGISGLAKGASLQLIPTGEASRISLRVATSYQGIPLTLDLDNLGALTATASLAPNQVHVYLGDPTRRGNIEIGAGPLKLEGSELEILARYRTYDTQRMLSSMGRLLSTEGIPLAAGLSVEADGVVRLGIPRGPVVAELAVLLPQAHGSIPAYLWSFGGSTDDRGGAGAVLTLGGRGRTAAGNVYSGSLFVGAVPGSYAEIDIKKGHASLYGISLPDRLAIPTTAIAGLRATGDTRTVHWDATLGVFANPAGLVTSPYLVEPTVGGAFAGVTYRNRHLSVGVHGVAEVNRDRQLSGGGARLSLGWTF